MTDIQLLSLLTALFALPMLGGAMLDYWCEVERANKNKPPRNGG